MTDEEIDPTQEAQTRVIIELWCDLKDEPAHMNESSGQRKQVIGRIGCMVNKAGIGFLREWGQSRAAYRFRRFQGFSAHYDSSDLSERNARWREQFFRLFDPENVERNLSRTVQSEETRGVKCLDDAKGEHSFYWGRISCKCPQCGHVWIFDLGNARVASLLERRARVVLAQRGKQGHEDSRVRTPKFRIRCSELLAAEFDVKGIKAAYPDGNYPPEVLERLETMRRQLGQ